MEKDIKKFLEDLYKLDPSLRKKEDDLIRLINKMLETRPDTKLDEKFAEDLRRELVANADYLKSEEEKVNRNFNIMEKFAYVIGGAVVCAVLLVSFYYPVDDNQIVLGLGEFNVDELSDNAFGEIDLSDQYGETAVTDLGLGGAGGVGGAEKSFSSSIAPIETQPRVIAPKTYNYVYNGEQIELNENEDFVYRYKISEYSSGSIASILKDMDFGLVDVGKFSNLGVQNISFYEDKSFGYSVYVDLKIGMISIQKNWGKWPQDDRVLECSGDLRCIKESELSIEDVPSDDKLISLANGFLDRYSIDKSNYGEPEVRDDWKIYYEQNKDKMAQSVPESMQIIYPLVVNGYKVYDQAGYSTGLSVSVDIKNMKVSGVHGLRAESYQSSKYNLITDLDEIIDTAEKGGFYPYMAYGSNGGEKIELKLGTPERGLVRVYNYKNNKQEEMLIPGLIFTIEYTPEGYFGRNRVVVLLVEGLVDNNPEPPVYRIME